MYNNIKHCKLRDDEGKPYYLSTPENKARSAIVDIPAHELESTGPNDVPNHLRTHSVLFRAYKGDKQPDFSVETMVSIGHPDLKIEAQGKTYTHL